jgi:DNA-binding transcriptional ArsR family regulator
MKIDAGGLDPGQGVSLYSTQRLRIMVSGELNETLVAVADPTRRAILRRLAGGEARVTELAAPFPMSLNAVSKHIRVLERAGLVRRRRLGREHLLSFDPRPLDAAAEWIEAQRGFWTARLDALEAALRAADAAGPAPGSGESQADPHATASDPQRT